MNRSIAHNAFSVPVITPATGILNWIKRDISDLDITTSKILTVAGGRGLRSIEDLYETRTVGTIKHLEEVAEKQFVKAGETAWKEIVMHVG